MTPEAYAKQHQKAFRTAFDFLTKHFPPGDGAEWWKQAAKDCSVASIAAEEDPLAIELLTAVMNYLGDEYKKRREERGETDN